MSTFVHAGCNANHFVDAAVGAEENSLVDFPGILASYGVQHLMAETSSDELVGLNGDIPTDTHLVTFTTLDGAVTCDAVRAFTKVDIFDAYHDAGLQVKSIESGFGSIKPKLYGIQSTKKKV